MNSEKKRAFRPKYAPHDKVYLLMDDRFIAVFVTEIKFEVTTPKASGKYFYTVARRRFDETYSKQIYSEIGAYRERDLFRDKEDIRSRIDDFIDDEDEVIKDDY